MNRPLQIRFFVHSLVSDWNHGNAHFLRGLARALVRQGHSVRSYEELGAWSLRNLVDQERERSIEAIDRFRATYPELDVHFYRNDSSFSDLAREQLRGVDLVIIHEWNEPQIVNQVLALKAELGFKALFHDTHHRAYSNAGQILRFHLHLVDGILAFGEAIRRIYLDGFGVKRAWTFHEGADVESFYPLNLPKAADVLWIGNWGDEERTRELEEFLIAPAKALGCRTVVHGVRYPDTALERLASAGIDYRGYLPNLQAPRAYGESLLALHVPRRQYANGLAGTPTIRVFEALACGAALVCSPWSDVERLFHSGSDFIVAKNGIEMQAEIARLLADDRARMQLGESGLATIRSRHTCAHRAEQLVGIYEELKS